MNKAHLAWIQIPRRFSRKSFHYQRRNNAQHVVANRDKDALKAPILAFCVEEEVCKQQVVRNESLSKQLHRLFGVTLPKGLLHSTHTKGDALLLPP